MRFQHVHARNIRVRNIRTRNVHALRHWFVRAVRQARAGIGRAIAPTVFPAGNFVSAALPIRQNQPSRAPDPD